MDSTCLRTLNFITPIHLRSIASLFRPFLFEDIRKNRYFSLSSSSPRLTPSFCSTERGDANSLPHGVGEVVGDVSRNRLLQVVLVSPQIPGNTGCIARTCAASAVGLHLVEPLGFQVDDAKLKRAGLDYWPYPTKFRTCVSPGPRRPLMVSLKQAEWPQEEQRGILFHGGVKRSRTRRNVEHDLKRGCLCHTPKSRDGEKRLLAFTKRGTAIHSDFSYRQGDWLVFGSETCGLPHEVLLDCNSDRLGGGTIRIPMVETYVRCLNLSVSVGIALYEASRQLNYEQLQFTSETFTENEKSFITEDVFA